MSETLFTKSGETGSLVILGNSNVANTLDLTNNSNSFNAVLTWAGGAASRAFTIPGLTTTGSVAITQRSAANAVTITSWVITANTVTITWSGNPGAVVLDCSIALISSTIAG